MQQSNTSLKYRMGITASIFALGVGLGFGLLKHTPAHAAVNIKLSPQSGWSSTMIEAATPQDGYCALTRKYNQDVVLTIGKSARKEYSLAVDFKDANLTLDKGYRVTIQPKAGQVRAFNAKPTSSNAMVVRLGNDNGFFKSLEQSGELKFSLGDQQYNFEVDDLKVGQDNLEKCVASLTGENTLSDDALVENAESADIVDTALAVGSGEKPKVSKPIEMSRIDSRPKVITRQAVQSEVIKTKTVQTQAVQTQAIKSQVSAVPAVKVEKPVVLASSEPVVGARPFSTPLSSKSKSKTPKVSQKEMEALKNEQYFPKPFSSGDSEAKVKSERPSEPQKAEIIKKPRPPEPISISEAPQQKPKATAQKQAIKEQLEIAKENSNETNIELTKVRGQLNELERENRALYLDARKARGEVDAAVVETGSEALKRLRAYEKKLEAAQADNLNLSRELEEMRRSQEDVQLSKLSASPDVQQSMRRYNEAEREIKRLGTLLEQQRLSHRQEKIELENMLFDPAVTDEAQRKKLSALETQLSQAQVKMKEVSQNAEKVNLQRQQRLKTLEQELSQAKEKEESLKIESKKIEAEAKKIAAAEAKLVALMEKEEALKLKEKRLQAEQKEISMAEEKIALAKQRQDALAKAEAKMKLEAQRMAQEKARLAEVKRKEKELLDTQAKIKLQEQKMVAEKARLAEVKRKEQELAQVQAKIAAEKLRLAQEQKRQQELAQAEAKIEAEQARLTEIKKREQQLAQAQAKMKQEQQRIATLERQEKELAQAQKSLEAQQALRLQGQGQARVSTQAGGTRVFSNAPHLLEPAAGMAKFLPTKKVQQASVNTNASSFNQGQLKNVLTQSGLTSVSAIRQQGQGNYYWKAGGMTGKAQIASGRQSLDQFVQSYIRNEKKNCRGDFASLPASVSGGKTAYELACIGSTGGKSSSVVFTQKGRDVIAIAHETTADNMDAAIDARDKVASHL